MRTALQYSKTWGEFRRAVGEEAYQLTFRRMSKNLGQPIGVPKDGDLFDAGEIPGYLDGDYPDWLQGQMEMLLPEDICAKFGERITTRLNGDYLHVDPSFKPRIVSALRERGYRVQRREDLLFT